MRTGIARNAGSLLATSAAQLPIGLAASILITRALTIEDRGLYALAFSIASAGVIVSQLGWPSAVIYRLRRSKAPPETVAGTALATALGLSALAAILGWSFERPILDTFLPGAPRVVLYMALALIPAELTGMFMSGVARGLDRFGWQNSYRIGVSLGRLSAFGLLIIVAGGSLMQFLGASLAVSALGALGLCVVVLRFPRQRPRATAGELAATARIGAPVWVHALAGNLHERVDIFMLAALLHQPERVALYAIAAGLVGYLKLVPEALAQATMPELAARQREQAGALAADTLRHGMLFVVSSLILAAALVPPLIPRVYGWPYADSVLPFLILLPGVALHAVYRLLARYFFATDRQRVNVAIQLVAAVFNIALNALWIPLWGIAGAALASLVTYSLEGGVMILLFCRSTRISPRRALVPDRADLRAYWRILEGLLARLRPPR